MKLDSYNLSFEEVKILENGYIVYYSLSHKKVHETNKLSCLILVLKYYIGS